MLLLLLLQRLALRWKLRFEADTPIHFEKILQCITYDVQCIKFDVQCTMFIFPCSGALVDRPPTPHLA